MKKPTAKQMLKRYPDLPLRENCLLDIACPECGHRSNFEVAVVTMADLVDDGTDANCGDHEWDGKSVIQCQACHCTKRVKDFTFNGLDELIEMNQKQPK